MGGIRGGERGVSKGLGGYRGGGAGGSKVVSVKEIETRREGKGRGE